VTRWLAGVFDPRGRTDAARLIHALAPNTATIVDQPPLMLAYSGPATSASEPICLLDGHLDNASELLKDLGGAEAIGTMSHPEELLTVAYRRWGRDLLPRLRGDFVLLIWDREREEGLIARDQLGVRPYYLHDADGCLRFASEIRHLLALLPQRPAPDPAGVAHWIALSNRPGSQTLYAGIRRLEPGGMLTLDRSGVHTGRYWAARFEEPMYDQSEAQITARTQEALQLAVRRRIDADGLTGVLMSGGLDSSSVAALCSEQAQGGVYACSATFPEHPATDEAELIRALQRELALPAINAEVRPGGLLASALESLAAWEMPLLGWGDFWTLPLMRAAAARGVTTMLDGDGGDQVFGARTYLLADALRAGHPLQTIALAYQLPGAVNRPPRRAVARILRDFGLAGALPYRLHEVLRAPLASRTAPGWLRPQATRDLIDSSDPLAWKHLDGPRWWAYDAYVLTRGIDEVGVFEHQRRRAALAGVEARHPLLDLDLVELGLRQPPRATLDPRFSRPLLRASMAGLLPDAVRLRPEKALFDSLIADCLAGPDGVAVRRLLTDPGVELRAYVDASAVQRALFESDVERRGNPFRWMWQVWRLVTLECWLRYQRGHAEGVLAPGTAASPARLAIEAASGTAA